MKVLFCDNYTIIINLCKKINCKIKNFFNNFIGKFKLNK